MPNSSISDGDERKLAGPGRRTGVGSESVVPYMHDELETKPQELPPDQPKPRGSLVSRMRRAMFKLKK